MPVAPQKVSEDVSMDTEQSVLHLSVGWDYVKEKSDDTECRYKGELEAILEPSAPVELRRISHRSLSCTGRRSNLLVESFIGGPVE